VIALDPTPAREVGVVHFRRRIRARRSPVIAARSPVIAALAGHRQPEATQRVLATRRARARSTES